MPDPLSHHRLAADALVRSRLAGGSCADFPGGVPGTLDHAYAIQREAIALWPDAIAGWKVGRLSAELAARYGVERFIGPVFARDVRRSCAGEVAEFAMFEGGSAAFEAEFMVWAGLDPAGRIVPERLTTGIEVASSPVATLPALGSLASVADLGNNAGQIVGEAVPIALFGQAEALSCETRIDGGPPVRRTAASLPGGIVAAFGFAVEQAARLGHPLRPGQFVSTGAVTGMHPVRPGMECQADFGDFGAIACRVVPRRPA